MPPGTSYDIVFEGGGAKGSVFIGALRELFSRGAEPRRLVGTSAGAITATMVAAGFTPDEMTSMAREKLHGEPRFASFMDEAARLSAAEIDRSMIVEMLEGVDVPGLPGPVEDRILRGIAEHLLGASHLRSVVALLERGALYEGEAFRLWMEEKLLEKDLAGLTLEGFHDRTGKDLSLVVTDVDAQRRRVLNHRTAPECPVAWAVRMSMSLPLIWREVEWRPAWGPCEGEDVAGHAFVDGGIVSNFALDLIADESPETIAAMGAPPDGGAEILGLLIDESLPVAGEPPPGSSRKSGVVATARERTLGRVTRLVDVITGARDSASIARHGSKVCRLPALGFGTTDFGLPDDRLQRLIDAGAGAMRTHLDGRR